MIPTIFFEKEAYTTSSTQVMGRQAAGNSFLSGLLKHYPGDELWFLSNTENLGADLPRRALKNTKKIVKQLTTENIAGLSQSGLLYYPAPDISNLSWKRTIFGERMWSICGITHTTSSDRIMDAIGQLPISPVRPWDAIICTSEAVKANIAVILEAKLKYLAKEIGATKFNLPEFPVIPLGLNIKNLTANAEIGEIRSRYNISKDAIVLLYLGRLSFHAKANPFQMYKALNEVAGSVSQELVLVECGWFSTQYIEDSFKSAFSEICQGKVTRLCVNGTDQQVKKDFLKLSDIFISLSDNIQETFGITPLEAMASGLPVVVSEWNGYKETVDDNCGYKIPSVMPAAGLGSDLINRYALSIDDYDQYLGNVSNFVSVCQNTLVARLTTLVTNKSLRIKIGESARQHALSYDWSNIIPQYDDLWRELEKKRKLSSSQSKVIWAERLDPFKAFSTYPSKNLESDDILYPSHTNLTKNDKEVEKVLGLVLTNYCLPVTGNSQEVLEVLNTVSPKGTPLKILLGHFEDAKKAQYLRIVYWLLKVNLLHYTSSSLK